MNENKFVPTSAVPVHASPVSVKLSTYDGKTNWEVYKTQFCISSEANGWNEGVKACQLAASLRDENKTPENRRQEYASEVERLANLAFSDHPTTLRKTISLQYFVDELKDGKIQKTVTMADVQDLKSALLYALKLEAANEASCRDSHSIRGIRGMQMRPANLHG
ncbi:gag-Pol polyprotein [Trichonephila clavipes]|nr:gag-Pol polyprotein [Trichonephila clavipes]